MDALTQAQELASVFSEFAFLIHAPIRASARCGFLAEIEQKYLGLLLARELDQSLGLDRRAVPFLQWMVIEQELAARYLQPGMAGGPEPMTCLLPGTEHSGVEIHVLMNLHRPFAAVP